MVAVAAPLKVTVVPAAWLAGAIVPAIVYVVGGVVEVDVVVAGAIAAVLPQPVTRIRIVAAQTATTLIFNSRLFIAPFRFRLLVLVY